MSKILKSRNFLRIIILILFVCVLGTAMSLLIPKKRTAQAALTGAGTQFDPVKIYSPEDMQEFANRVNSGQDVFFEKHVKLMNNIDMSTISVWTPIGNTATQTKAFQGTFDGNGKTISNLTINATADYAGLFGYAVGATIKNVTLSNPQINSTKANVGALVGYLYTGNVKAANNVTTLRKSEITGCNVLGGSVNATGANVGGLIGYVNAAANTDHEVVITQCTVKGTGTNYVPTKISALGENVGSIIGYGIGMEYKALSTGASQAGIHIKNCSSTATVTARGCGGGIAGRVQGTLIEECYTTGAIRCVHYGTLGGIVGQLEGRACKVTDCFTMGDISAVGTGSGDYANNGHTYAGGIVGCATGVTHTVMNCLVTGKVLACSPWMHHSHTSSNVCRGWIICNGVAGGIIGVNSTKTSNVGGCAVASSQVSGVSNRTTSVVIDNSAKSNIGIALSSPFANGWTNAKPTMIAGTKNIYYKDLKLSEQRYLDYKTCTSIQGDKIDLPAFKVQQTYTDLGWAINTKNRVWGIGTSFNNGFPYLSNCPRGNIVEYPYGSVYNPILINNEDDFRAMRDNCNNGGEMYDGLYIKQTADLDMTDMQMTGSSNGVYIVVEYRNYSFRGNYDGGMHRMKNVHVLAANNNMGIFSYAINASFKNIIVENPLINNETVGSKSNAGILIGNSLGNLTMDNCAILGGRLAVPKMNLVGALVGQVARTGNYISRCFSSATVIGGLGVGGLIGYAAGVHLSQCYTTGDVENTLSTWSQTSNGNTYVGLSRSTGGLIGELYRPYGGINSSWNNKTCTYQPSSLNDAKCFAYDESLTATPTTNTSYSTIDNCYASGRIKDYSTGNYNNGAGGLVGRAMGEAAFTNCYFNGKLEASGNSTANIAENTAAMVGLIDSGIVNVTFTNCLSAIQSVKLEHHATSAKISVAGYYGTYRTTTPQMPMGCVYVPVADMPEAITLGGGGAVDGGNPATLDDIKTGKVFGDKYTYTVTIPAENEEDPPTVNTITADGLNWDMTDIWTHDPNLNDGFPMLKNLIVDTTELNTAIAKARTYNSENFSEETFSALMNWVNKADKEISDLTITEITKVQYMNEILKAIDGLRPDTKGLAELYERVNKDMLPYKQFYVSFTLVESLLPGAKEILDEPENFYNNDVKSVYDALKLAVDNLRVDKTELNKAIEEANAIMLNASSYPDNDIKTLQNALKAAVTVNNDDAILAPQVNNATKQLQDALSKMALDKTGLLNQIIDAYANIGVVVKYDVGLGDTEKSIIIENEDNRVMSMELIHYAEFEKALNTAVTVLQNKESPSQTIINAMFELDVATNALKLKTDKLEEISSRAATVLLNEKYYTAECIAKLKEEKAKADDIINGTEAAGSLATARDNYDATCKSLEAAIGDLKVNKAELLRIITKARAETQGAYEQGTWDKLQEEINKAQAVYDKAEPTVKEVADAISALNAALQNLDVSLDYLRELLKQARNILDNDKVKALYPEDSITDLADKTEKAEALEKLGSSANVTDVKFQTNTLEAAINALKVSKDEMNRYIEMALVDYSSDYVKDGVYSAESTQAFRDLAQDAMNKRSSMTDEEVITYTFRLQNAYESLRANSDALAVIVNRLSAMSNKKYRQDNDGKWIVDEETGNMKVFVIYEDKSWKALETELAKAKELLLSLKSTPAQINESIAALTAAEAGLIVDTSELELRMQKALDLLAQEDLYKDTSLDALQEAYDAAKKLLNDAKDSGEKLVMSDVQKCLDALLHAINSMEADLGAISTLLSFAEELINYKEFFTANTFANLQSNYKQVNSLVEQSAELDASSVSVLSKMLIDAMKSLEITTDALQEFIDTYNDLKSNKQYLLGFDEFEENISTYKGLLKKSALKITTYTEAEDKVKLYSTAINELQSSLNGLLPNWVKFEELINEGKALKAKADEETDTTDLDAALETAEAMLTAKEANYKAMLVSVEEMESALKGLKILELDQLIQSTKKKMASEYLRPDGNYDDSGESGEEGDGEGSGEVVENGTKLSIYYCEGVTIGDTYTLTSYRALQGALKNGEAVLKITNADYDLVMGAMTAIKNAIAGLVVDPALLNHLIKECEQGYSDEYYETEGNAAYEAYSTALEAAKAAVAEATTSLEDYLKAYDALVAAKDKLVFKSSALADIIAKAEKKLADDGAKCSASSKEALQAQINSAKNNKDAAGSAGYNKACNDLLDAMANLTYIDGLQAEIARVQPFVDFGNPDESGNFYSEGSFKELVELLANAKVLLEKDGLRQYEVDSMIALLKVCDDKDDGLLLNVTEYKKFVDEQNKFVAENEGMYTLETWKPYTEAVANLDSLIKLPKYEVTAVQLEDAKKAIENAITDLEEDSNKVFMLKESNTTFKFIHGDGSAVEFAEHQYDAENPLYLTNIALGDSVADIIAQFDNTEVKAFTAKGEEITDLAAQVVATGIVLKVMTGDQVLDEITLVIKGEMTGDGKINTSDKNQLFGQVNGTKTLEGAFKLACDINGDGKINTSDKNQLFGHMNGSRNLFAGLSVKEAA